MRILCYFLVIVSAFGIGSNTAYSDITREIKFYNTYHSPKCQGLVTTDPIIRYIRITDKGVKLFLNKEALRINNPTYGFAKSNHFDNSCGPTAAENLLRWYGIVDTSSGNCYQKKVCGNKNKGIPNRTNDTLYRTPIDGLEPGCSFVHYCDTVDARRLYDEMQTNRWYIGPVGPLPGSNTENVRKSLRPHIVKYMGTSKDRKTKYEKFTLRYKHSKPDLGSIISLLKTGTPVMVVYRTPNHPRGHYAVIVGVEFDGDNPKLIIANGYDYRWREFRQLWERKYDPDKNSWLPNKDN